PRSARKTAADPSGRRRILRRWVGLRRRNSLPSTKGASAPLQETQRHSQGVFKGHQEVTRDGKWGGEHQNIPLAAAGGGEKSALKESPPKCHRPARDFGTVQDDHEPSSPYFGDGGALSEVPQL